MLGVKLIFSAFFTEKKPYAYIAASESCALFPMNGEFCFELKPGEIVEISRGGCKRIHQVCFKFNRKFLSIGILLLQKLVFISDETDNSGILYIRIHLLCKGELCFRR